jgi:penicillin-binding protein 1B
VNRREFTGPSGAVPAMSFEVRLGWSDHVEEIYDDDAGTPRREVWLEPETLGALADDAPVDRLLVTLDEMPAHFLDALFVVEDRRFREHDGVDLRRLAGALVANLRAGGVREGGSTITQQLVKNVFLSTSARSCASYASSGSRCASSARIPRTRSSRPISTRSTWVSAGRSR